jgi:hypothetical protein
LLFISTIRTLQIAKDFVANQNRDTHDALRYERTYVVVFKVSFCMTAVSIDMALIIEIVDVMIL